MGVFGCWGGLSAAPSGRFSEITSGSDYSCALRIDRLAQCWGSQQGIKVPPRLRKTSFQAIDAGIVHVCGIRTADKLIKCWGERGLDDTRKLPLASSRTPFLAVDSGSIYNCGVQNDQSVVCWGNVFGNPKGEINGVRAHMNSRTLYRHERTDIFENAITLRPGTVNVRAVTAIVPEGSTALVWIELVEAATDTPNTCLLYTSPSPRDRQKSRMPSSA